MSTDFSATAEILSRARPKFPYPGLRPFEADEWSIFFGREQMIDEVIERLAAHHFVIIHGASGCGKSSLVRAGVLPTLAGQHLRAGARWQSCTMRPSNGPLWNLAAAFARLERGTQDLERTGEIMRQLNRQGTTLRSIAASLAGLEGCRLCLLIDQFEELFRFERETSREEAEVFVDLLLRSNAESKQRQADGLALDDGTSVHVVVTMRSEFLGECARFNGLAEIINQSQFLVPRIDRDGLLRAIRRPAQLYGGEVSLDLAERLLADVAGGEDELPLIQHGLMYLWNQASAADPDRNVCLNAAPLEAAGGLAALLSKHADALVNEVASDPAHRYAVEHLFRAITHVNAEGQTVRRPRAFRDLVAVTQLPEHDLRHIIDALRRDGVSFLLPALKEPIAGNTIIDISHESLIRQWKTLSGWVAKEARAARDWQYLIQVAERNRRLSGAAFTAAVKDYDEINPTPTWAERYGGGFESVTRLIKASLALKRRRALLSAAGFASALIVVVGVVFWLYRNQVRALELEQLQLESAAQQQRAVSRQNFLVAVALLDQLTISLQRGDISSSGARDMLSVVFGIVERVPKDDSPETVALLARLKWLASDVYAFLGEPILAYVSAESARALAEPLAASDPNNPVLLSMLFNSIWRMGDAVADQNSNQASQERALGLYREAEAIARRLLATDPTAEGKRDVAFILQKIGDSYQVLQDWDGAIAAYREASSIMKVVVAAQPDKAIWRRELANVTSRLGQALSGKGNLDAAIEQFQEALAIRSDLAKADSENDSLQANVASSHRDIARIYARQNQLDAALTEYREAIDILYPLYIKDWNNANWQALLAPWYAEYGSLLRRKGDLAAALEQYRKSYVVRRELAMRDPSVIGRQRSFAVAGMEVADLMVEQHQNLDEAVRLYREAISVLDDLRPRYDLEVVHAYVKIGDIFKTSGDIDNALREYEKASSIARTRATDDPANPSWQKALADSYTKIGALLVEQGNTHAAIEHYQSALQFVMALAAKYPDRTAWAAFVESLKSELAKLGATP